jgi:hypothetical protein
VDAKSHTLVAATRDSFKNTAIYLANYDVDFEVNVNPVRQFSKGEICKIYTFKDGRVIGVLIWDVAKQLSKASSLLLRNK